MIPFVEFICFTSQRNSLSDDLVEVKCGIPMFQKSGVFHGLIIWLKYSVEFLCFRRQGIPCLMIWLKYSDEFLCLEVRGIRCLVIWLKYSDEFICFRSQGIPCLIIWLKYSVEFLCFRRQGDSLFGDLVEV